MTHRLRGPATDTPPTASGGGEANPRAWEAIGCVALRWCPDSAAPRQLLQHTITNDTTTYSSRNSRRQQQHRQEEHAAASVIVPR